MTDATSTTATTGLADAAKTKETTSKKTETATSEVTKKVATTGQAVATMATKVEVLLAVATGLASETTPTRPTVAVDAGVAKAASVVATMAILGPVAGQESTGLPAALPTAPPVVVARPTVTVVAFVTFVPPPGLTTGRVCLQMAALVVDQTPAAAAAALTRLAGTPTEAVGTTETLVAPTVPVDVHARPRLAMAATVVATPPVGRPVADAKGQATPAVALLPVATATPHVAPLAVPAVDAPRRREAQAVVVQTVGQTRPCPKEAETVVTATTTGLGVTATTRTLTH